MPMGPGPTVVKSKKKGLQGMMDRQYNNRATGYKWIREISQEENAIYFNWLHKVYKKNII